jgi:hypothetical protein
MSARRHDDGQRETKERTMVTHAGGEQEQTPAHAATTATRRQPHGSPAAKVSHHGNSVAAWSMVLIVGIGSLLASIGVAVPSMTFVVIGAVVIVIGLIVGKVMSLAGYGSVKPADPETPHGVA